MVKLSLLLIFALFSIGCKPITWQQMVESPFDSTKSLKATNEKNCWKHWNFPGAGHTTWCYFETSQTGPYDITTTIFSNKYGHLIPKEKRKASPKPVVIALKLKKQHTANAALFKTLKLENFEAWVDVEQGQFNGLIGATHHFTPVHYWHKKNKDPKLKHWINPEAGDGQVWLVECVLNDAGKVTAVLLYFNWEDNSRKNAHAFSPTAYVVKPSDQSPWFATTPMTMINENRAILHVGKHVVWNRQVKDDVLADGQIKTSPDDLLLAPKWFGLATKAMLRTREEHQLLGQQMHLSLPLIKIDRSAPSIQFNQVAHTLQKIGYHQTKLGVVVKTEPTIQPLAHLNMTFSTRKKSKDYNIYHMPTPVSPDAPAENKVVPVIPPTFTAMRVQIGEQGVKVGLLEQPDISSREFVAHTSFDINCDGFHICRDKVNQAQLRARASKLDVAGKVSESVEVYNALLIASGGLKLSGLVHQLRAKHKQIKTLVVEVQDPQLPYQTMLDLVALMHSSLKTKTQSCGLAFDSAQMFRHAELCVGQKPAFDSIIYQIIMP